MVMSKIGKKVAQKITSQLDNLESAMFGGKLEKAELIAYTKPDLGTVHKKVKFFVNPETITVSKETQLKEEPAAQGTTEKKYSLTYPICLTIPDIIFDTYDTRENVRTKYINDIEAMLDYIPATHHLPVCVFNWGQFTASPKIKPEYKFYITKCDVTYTLFLPDGTPVRAKVKLSLEQLKTKPEEMKNNPKESPDHAKLYTVKKGDTLQGIAQAEYEDPGEWRRIAKTNNIDDPLELRPGMKLLVPPILK